MCVWWNECVGGCLLITVHKYTMHDDEDDGIMFRTQTDKRTHNTSIMRIELQEIFGESGVGREIKL